MSHVRMPITRDVRPGRFEESAPAPVRRARTRTMSVLVRNWWMMAIRGVLAILFGACILAWPAVTLPMIVVLFAAYAVLDGIAAIGAAVRASERLLDAWPVAGEGIVSVVLGVLALVWPFVSREFLQWIAAWGIVTGVLEILAAARLPRDTAGYWLLGTGGVSSLFLAVLIVMLPHAAAATVGTLIGAYAVVFGASVSLAAFRFRR